MWVGVLLGLFVATVAALLLLAVAHRRGKETQFGYEFLDQTFVCFSPQSLRDIFSKNQGTGESVEGRTDKTFRPECDC